MFLNGSTHPILDRQRRNAPASSRSRATRRASAISCEELARTRSELVDSEARFRNMADHAPLMMWVTEPDGDCTYLNRRWYEFTGQTEEEALGLGWTDATHPDDKAHGRATLPGGDGGAGRRSGSSTGCAAPMACIAGRSMPRAPRFGDGRHFLGHVGSVIDIDERREAEDALRQANALLAAVMEAVPGVVYAKDLEGRMLAANRGTVDLVGKPLDAILGRTDREFLDDPVSGRGSAWPTTSGSWRSNRTEVLEEEVSLPDGTQATWLSTKSPFRDADGDVVGLIGSSIDITERKRAEQALQRLNATLEEQVVERTADRDRMWQLSTDVMLVADFQATVQAREPGLDDAVPVARGRTGRSHHFLDFDPSRRLPATLAEVARAGARRDDASLREPLSRQGRQLSLAVVDRRARGRASSMPSGATSRRTRKQAEALRATEEALRQAQKMEAVGQLTGGLAHDFNNLLTGMMGNLELLQHRLARGPTATMLDRFINAAQGAGRRAAALTQRLLAFSRRQTLDPKPTDVNRLIAGMEDLLRRTVGPTTDIEIVGAAGLWTAMIDPGPARERAAQPVHQRARRDARWRQDHDRDRATSGSTTAPRASAIWTRASICRSA